jgi:hypothetical protein
MTMASVTVAPEAQAQQAPGEATAQEASPTGARQAVSQLLRADDPDWAERAGGDDVLMDRRNAHRD